jgi:signal peptidase II
LLREHPGLAAVAAGAAARGLIGLTLRQPGRQTALSSGLVLGGWGGNQLDRLRRGAVTDFLDLGVGSLRWPAFNLADAAIVGGAALLARALAE